MNTFYVNGKNSYSTAIMKNVATFTTHVSISNIRAKVFYLG